MSHRAWRQIEHEGRFAPRSACFPAGSPATHGPVEMPVRSDAESSVRKSALASHCRVLRAAASINSSARVNSGSPRGSECREANNGYMLIAPSPGSRSMQAMLHCTILRRRNPQCAGSVRCGVVHVPYTTPADVMHLNAASDDWHTAVAFVDLRKGVAFFRPQGGQGRQHWS